MLIETIFGILFLIRFKASTAACKNLFVLPLFLVFKWLVLSEYFILVKSNNLFVSYASTGVEQKGLLFNSVINK